MTLDEAYPVEASAMLSWEGREVDQMRAGRRLGAVAAAPIVGLLLAAPVAAFELNGGCSVTLTSMDADGEVIDTASGPGSGGTQADPFLIDWDGTVSWQSNSGSQVFKNHSWQTYVFNIPTPVRGGDPNEDEGTTGSGTAGVSENAPFRITGLYHVSGEINGDEGAHCDGNGYFQLQGDPLGTVPFFLGAILVFVGGVLVATARPDWGG
jgi:hypothetical protein